MKKVVATILGVVVLTAFNFAYSGENPNVKPATLTPHASLDKAEPLMPFINLQKNVSKSDFKVFLANLNLEQRKALMLSLCKNEDEKAEVNEKKHISAKEIENKALWVSSHWLSYKFKSFDYHETVKWVAKKHDINNTTANTFQLEHLIFEKIFSEQWAKLTPEQQKEILETTKVQSIDKMQITGIALLMSLSPSGLPFLFGTANADLATAFVLNVHSIKLVAMKNSNYNIADYILQ